MRKFALVLLLLGLFVAAPASAGISEVLVGLNGVLTAVADPVQGILEGKACLEACDIDMGVASPVTDRIFGFIVGAAEAVNRVILGLGDVLTGGFLDLSPEPAVSIPGLT